MDFGLALLSSKTEQDIISVYDKQTHPSILLWYKYSFTTNYIFVQNQVKSTYRMNNNTACITLKNITK